MKNIVIGRYIPGNSFLYSLDPRTKILALLILMIGVFVIDHIMHMVYAIAIIFLVLLLGKISIKRIYLGLRPLLFLLIFTFTFQIIFNRHGELLFEETLYYSPVSIALAAAIGIFWFFTKRFIKFRLLYFLMTLLAIGTVLSLTLFPGTFATGRFAVYEEGLFMALFIMLRLIIIVTLSTMLTMTTKPTDLNLGLEQILAPLKILRINAEEIAMIISISLRYIPTLLDEANKIMLAQASRGVDFEEGKMKEKVVQIVSLLVPMFIISFKRSDDLANAMEARSFAPGRPRTRLHVLTWKRLDSCVLALSFLLLVTAILSRVLL